jgi:hypothetical protein
MVCTIQPDSGRIDVRCNTDATARVMAVGSRMHGDACSCMWCHQLVVHSTHPAGTREVLYIPLISLWLGPRYPIDDSTLNKTNSA